MGLSVRTALAPSDGCFASKAIPAYRCRKCDGYYTLLSDTAFAKTRQSPSHIVLLLRGIAKGEPTARLAREFQMDRKHLGQLRQCIQENPFATLPTTPLEGTQSEADELYQNAGEKYAASRSG
jgi:hypothetical protein